MPYLRLSSLPLDEATKRHLADELTATILDVLPDQKPEWTSVHFTAFAPEDFALAGRLVSDGAVPDIHLELSSTPIDERAWRALRNRLTDSVIDALAIDPADRWHVNVKLNTYEAHSFAVAGDAIDELPQPSEVADEAPPRRSWLRPAVLIGFALGAYGGYRWFASRVATDATIDAAPPLENYGEGVASGQADPRYTIATTSGPDED